MTVRTILSGALAMALLTGLPAQARDVSHGGGWGGEPARDGRNGGGLPGVFGGRPERRDYQVAQANDPRVGTLEEQIRTLNGTLEELNFQVLQLQEQVRKMQEDNEFRFQELEKKSEGAVRPAKKSELPATGPATADAGTQPPVDSQGSASDAIPGTQAVTSGKEVAATSSAPTHGTPGPGAPPKTFGTIVFDTNGDVTGGDVGDKMTTVSDGSEPDSGTVVAALPQTDDPEELYRNSYNFILSGDYATAEAGFRDHISRFPSDGRASDAHFWLGESLLGQRKYHDAAETFLDASKTYPKSKKAPDMLLKLGVSLTGLDQHDVACATFAEVGKRYPEASAALKGRVKQEQARASC